MDEADGLAINFSSDPVAPPRKKKPQKRSAGPSQWTAPAASTSGPPATKKPRLASAQKRADRGAGSGGGGGGPKGGTRGGGGGAPKESGRPVLSSLFSHNPAVPELSLPERQPAGADVFSGRDFSELPLHPHLVTNVCKALGGAEMTKVQQKAIPAVLSGADCLIRAQTGSGKTLSYLLPIIQAMQAEEPPVTRESGLFALVVVPTRELALQTHSCAASLMKTFVRLVPGYLSGGEKTLSEKRRLRRGLNLLVATPGRLLAHIAASRNLRLSRLRWLVLDEADLLLDMGYERDVSSVLTAVQDQRAEGASSTRLQTLLLSATLDDRVQKLAGLSLHEPTIIDVAGDGSAICGADGALVTPGQLRQFVAVVPAKLRLVTLAAFILWKCSTREEGKLVVFMSTQDMVDYHACLLETCLPGRGGPDIRVFRLHGSLTQTERTGVFTEFRAAKTGVLVCTDVAARGVDLPRVRWTVQYTPPGRPADYVHRAGRTARGGSAGATLLLLTPAELQLLDTLSKAGLSVSDLSLEQILSSLVPEAGPRRSGTVEAAATRRSGTVEAAATQLQLTMEETVQQDRQLTQMARKAFTSLVRAYAAYPAETRRMLSVRSLHLGHYAKSLCLRETPTALGGWRPDPQSSAAAARWRGEKLPAGPGRPRVRIPQSSDLSEFQSGLEDAGTAPRKKKKKKGAR